MQLCFIKTVVVKGEIYYNKYFYIHNPLLLLDYQKLFLAEVVHKFLMPQL